MVNTRQSKTYECPKLNCTDIFNNRMSRKRHLSLCKGEDPDPANLSKPIKVEGGYKCSTCARKYTTPSGFSRHRKSCLVMLEKIEKNDTITKDQLPHKCPKCGKGFPTPSKMRWHENIHEGRALREQSDIYQARSMPDEQYFQKIVTLANEGNNDMDVDVI